jgi:hypothetical protein
MTTTTTIPEEEDGGDDPDCVDDPNTIKDECDDENDEANNNNIHNINSLESAATLNARGINPTSRVDCQDDPTTLQNECFILLDGPCSLRAGSCSGQGSTCMEQIENHGAAMGNDEHHHACLCSHDGTYVLDAEDCFLQDESSTSTSTSSTSSTSNAASATATGGGGSGMGDGRLILLDGPCASRAGSCSGQGSTCMGQIENHGAALGNDEHHHACLCSHDGTYVLDAGDCFLHDESSSSSNAASSATIGGGIGMGDGRLQTRFRGTCEGVGRVCTGKGSFCKPAGDGSDFHVCTCPRGNDDGGASLFGGVFVGEDKDCPDEDNTVPTRRRRTRTAATRRRNLLRSE